MGFIIACGDKYLKKEENNSFTPVNNQTLAYCFETKQAAKNAMSVLPKLYKNKGCKVIEYLTEVQEVSTHYEQLKNNMSLFKRNEAIEGPLTEISLEDIYEQMKQLSNTLAFLTQNKGYMECLLKYTDLATIDLLHQIELQSFGSVQGYRLMKQFKELRQTRRKYKDLLQLTLMIDQFNLEAFSNGQITERITNIENRTYQEKVLEGIFDKSEDLEQLVKEKEELSTTTGAQNEE